MFANLLMKGSSTLWGCLGMFCLFCLLPVLLLYAACGPEVREVGRYPSPDGKLVAIVEESNGDATTSYGYFVYVQPKRILFPRKQVALVYGGVTEGEYGVKVSWPSSHELVVRYDRARFSDVRFQGTRIAGRRFRLRLVGKDELP
ncbi:MAG TPA: hypothetical protein VGE01_02370 [Fimbriimonas sp.]